MEDEKIISLCLECENFSGKEQVVARKNNGQVNFSDNQSNWCNKYDKEPLLIEHRKFGMIPDVAECKGFRQK